MKKGGDISMAKIYLLKKGAAFLLSAAMVLTGVYVPGGGY